MQQSQLILPIYPPIYFYIVLCVLPGDSHPGTGYILSLAQFALNLYMLTQVFGAGDTAAAVAEEAIAAFGKIDILVNNAGIIKLSPAQEHTMEDFDAVMELNLRSLFLLTRDIARQMIALGHGKIVNTCSVQSFRGGSGDAAYVASKHAVHGLTRAWANEWGRYNIQVNGIAPGYMVTDNTATLRQNREAVAAITSQIPMGRWGRPEDLMGPVIFLASAASDYVNGHLLTADGGYLNA